MIRAAAGCAGFAVLSLAFQARAAAASDPESLYQLTESMISAFKRESTCAPLASRNLAMLHIAVFDARALASGRPTFYDYASILPEPEASHTAGLVAGWLILKALHPGQSFPEPDVSQQAHAIGLHAARNVLEERALDGSSVHVTYIPKLQEGFWRRTGGRRPPEHPEWPQVMPFCLNAQDQFRPQAPPAIDSLLFKEALKEVRAYGGLYSKKRTTEETESARFWSAFSYSVTPPGHWNEIAIDAARTAGFSAEQASIMLLLLNLSLADAAIAAWDCKFAYEFWRPEHAIEHFFPCEDPASAWVPLLEAPPHPDYVSGHSTLSGAAATILSAIWKDRPVAFKVRSSVDDTVIRSYTDFMACAREIGRSRILGGIHFSFSDEAGRKLGANVANQVREFSLARLAWSSEFDYGTNHLSMEGDKGR